MEVEYGFHLPTRIYPGYVFNIEEFHIEKKDVIVEIIKLIINMELGYVLTS